MSRNMTGEQFSPSMMGIFLKSTRPAPPENVQRTTLNVQRSTQKSRMGTGAVGNSQLSTLNSQLCRSASRCALRQIIPSRSFGTRDKESSHQRWSLLRSVKMGDKHRRESIRTIHVSRITIH